MVRLTAWVVFAAGLAACSKKSNDKQPAASPTKGSDATAKVGSAEGSAGSAAGSAVAAGSGAGSAAPAGPVRSLTGDLAVSGSITGTYHWNKKGDIFCGPGGVQIDFTTGKDHETAGTAMAHGLLDSANNEDEDENAHDLNLQVDTMAPARLSIISLDLPAPMKTSKGFKMTVGEDRHIQVIVDTTLTDIIVDPDAPKPKKSKKKVKKPAGPKVTIKGTLEIECPPLPK